MAAARFTRVALFVGFGSSLPWSFCSASTFGNFCFSFSTGSNKSPNLFNSLQHLVGLKHEQRRVRLLQAALYLLPLQRSGNRGPLAGAQ